MGSDGEKVNVSQYEHYRTDAETVQSLFICFVMKYAIHTHTHPYQHLQRTTIADKLLQNSVRTNEKLFT